MRVACARLGTKRPAPSVCEWNSSDAPQTASSVGFRAASTVSDASAHHGNHSNARPRASTTSAPQPSATNGPWEATRYGWHA